MKQSHVLLLLLVQIIVLLPLHCLSDDFVSSRATYYGSPDCKANPRGHCGYGEFGRNINNGEVSGVSWRLWNNGTGCGACYQVRCKIPPHCSEEGVYVVATDSGEGPGTDFILSTKAYGRMARPGTENQLYSFGVVDVEYQRIPCRYQGIIWCIRSMRKAIILIILPSLSCTLVVSMTSSPLKSAGGLQRVATYEKSVWCGSRFAESTKRHSHIEVFSLRKRRNQLGPIAKRYSRRLDRRSHLRLQHSTYLNPISNFSSVFIYISVWFLYVMANIFK